LKQSKRYSPHNLSPFHFPLYSPPALIYDVCHDRNSGTQPEFLALTEQTVLAALNHLDAANPIAMEVTRLVTTYTANFKSHVERLGYIPADILRLKPRWPIEAVAMRLTTEAIPDSLAQPRSSDAGT
jgi:hypothetical protein